MSAVQLEINNRYSDLADPDSATRQLFTAIQTSGAFPITPGELSIVFVSDAEIGQIHDDFMDDPTATDVITFPADEEMDSAGEIIVSVDHARTKAAELREHFSDELSLYLIHGWLHLAGYDDRNEQDRAAMRAAEQAAMAIVKKASPREDFTLINQPKNL